MWEKEKNDLSQKFEIVELEKENLKRANDLLKKEIQKENSENSKLGFELDKCRND